jgi:MFS family permease
MRFYYGWVVLGAASVLIFASGPGHSFGVNIFVDYFISDLKLSRSMVSLVWAGSLAVSSFMLPAVGYLLDTIGVRLVVLVSIIGFCIALVLMSQASGVISLAVAISLLRFFGPECLVLSANTTINRWFIRQRGFAMAVCGVVSNIMLAYPAFCTALIGYTGSWRKAYVQLAVMVGPYQSHIAMITHTLLLLLLVLVLLLLLLLLLYS